MNKKENLAKAKKLADSVPPLRASELKEINKGFIPYIFREKKTRKIWTTCCGRHEVIPKKEYSTAMYEVLAAAHQPETIVTMRPYSIHETRTHAPELYRDYTECPFCGTACLIKELGRTGNRDNLKAWKTFVVLRWHRGTLWACEYSAIKSYADKCTDLTALPRLTKQHVYAFRPGSTRMSETSYPGRIYRELLDFPKKLPLGIWEPSQHDNSARWDYTLIGVPEIKKSPFKYCLSDEYMTYNGGSALRFLALCCIAPRQVEMLMKMNLSMIISDLLEFKKWNAAVLDWRESHPERSMSLSKVELKSWLSGLVDIRQGLDVLKYYKQFKKKEIPCNFEDISTVLSSVPWALRVRTFKRLKQFLIPPSRWCRYMRDDALVQGNDALIQGNTGCASDSDAPVIISVEDLTQIWHDYIDSAEICGYDLSNPLNQMPRDLAEKHDMVTGAATSILNARRAEENKKRAAELSGKMKKRHRETTKKYGFEKDGYIITAPVDAEDIVNEGKILKHCVGGYADRHLDGKLTILFFRLASNPLAPLATIEMHGNRLIQIRGYDNDRGAKEVAEKKYKKILDSWLAWLQAGSKRNKDGSPKLPELKEKTKSSQGLAEAV